LGNFGRKRPQYYECIYHREDYRVLELHMDLLKDIVDQFYVLVDDSSDVLSPLQIKIRKSLENELLSKYSNKAKFKHFIGI